MEKGKFVDRRTQSRYLVGFFIEGMMYAGASGDTIDRQALFMHLKHSLSPLSSMLVASKITDEEVRRWIDETITFVQNQSEKAERS